MSTVHNSASLGDIAKNVIMAGDPLRAKYIAENFLTDAKCVNKVRNMLCYTGEYKGKKVSVMGHGMGMPSACIYTHELFNFYNVENIIRVGTCGGISKKLKLFDTIIAKKVYTTSNIGIILGLGDKNMLTSSSNLFDKANSLVKNNPEYIAGDIITSDVFYTYPGYTGNDEFVKMGALCVEMETFGLFAEAKLANKNALSILTVSDIVGTDIVSSSTQRQLALNNMIELALNTIFEL